MESIVGETKEDEIRPGETKDQTVVNDGGTKDQQAVDETTSAEEGEQKAIDETEASSGEASDQKEVDEANPERTGDPKVVDEGKSEEARERDTIDQTTPRETGDQNALDETNPEDAAAGVAARLASIPSDAIWRREIDNTVEGNSEITFPDGTTYNGEWLARQESKTQRTIIRHGKGFHMFTDASWYEGEWDFDRQHGEGEAEFPDGTIFKGSWHYGLMKAGSLSTPDGHVFMGEFEDNKMHGSGDMLYSNGAIYRGSWVNGKKHGDGHYTYSNGNTYEGRWIQDFCNGLGTYTSCKGWSYEGEFELGKRHGTGKIKYKGGDEFDGHFSHGSRHGKGKLTNAHGGFYDGEWVHDRKHGEGTFRWKDAPRGDKEPGFYTYTGGFSRGLRSGWGKLEYPTGEIYEGEWLNNLRHGSGVLHAHAFTYDGDFHLDKRHGKGTLFCQGQFTYVGEFEHGRQHGEAKLVTARGTSFLGSFFEGRPHGPAIVEQEIRPGLWALCRCEYANGRRVGIARVEGDKKSFTLQYDEHGTLISMKMRPQRKEEEKEMMRTYGRALTNHRKEFREVQEGIQSARSELPPAGERYLGQLDTTADEGASESGQPPTSTRSNREAMVELGDTSSAQGPSLPPLPPSLPPSHVESNTASAPPPPTSQDAPDTKGEAASRLEAARSGNAGLKEEEIVAWLGADAGSDPVSRSASGMAEEGPTIPVPDETQAEGDQR